MVTKFDKNTGQTIKAWLNKVQNVKFHYYYKPKSKSVKEQ